MILAFLFWLGVGGLVYFVEPATFAAIPLFFVLTFFALLLTFSLALASSRRGLLVALGTTIFLLLRYFGIGNIINFLIIVGLAVTIEIYFQKR